MSGGSLKRVGGAWASDTLPTKEADDSIPKEGWAFIGGLTGHDSYLYYNGKPVTNIRSIDYTVEAGGMSVMRIEIVAPKIKMVGKGIQVPFKRK